MKSDSVVAAVGSGVTTSPSTPGESETPLGPALIPQTYQNKLEASDQEDNAEFGNQIAVSSDGNTVVIGAHLDDAAGAGGSNRGAAYIMIRTGTVWSEQAKLVASDQENAAEFGRSVAISTDGNTVLIGANMDDANGGGGANRGAAYVFTRTGVAWSEQAKLVASDEENSAEFGYSAALSSDGNTAAIGAYVDDGLGGAGHNSGAVYVFTRSGAAWSQESKLLDAADQSAGYFGSSVDLSSDGNTLITGAWGNLDGTASSRGAAFVFTRSGTVWNAGTKLTPSDPENFANFGFSIAISGNGRTAAIAAGGNDASGGAGANRGAVYIFTSDGTTWSELTKLIAGDPENDASFGQSVALSTDGRTLIAGAFSDDGVGGTNQGSAYTFTASGTTWTQQAKLLAPDGLAWDAFGYGVGVSGDGTTAVVGAYQEGASGGTQRGSAYVYISN